MLYQAIAKYVRVSPRKVRLVAAAVKHLKPEEALKVLGGITKRAAKPLIKVITSALAGAKEKNADTAKLSLIKIEVTDGGSMKRWQAVSRGMAHGYKKRMAHIRIVLTDDEIKSQKSKIKDTREK